MRKWDIKSTRIQILFSQMKELIKKFIPSGLSNWYRNIKYLKFNNLSTKEVFTAIYKTNHWKSSESISGKGSEIAQTKSLIKDLNKLLVDMKVTSVLDIPCGDFKWMQRVELESIDYHGADIVEELIYKNKEQHKERNNLKFSVLNLIHDTLPKMDIIIVRDCFVHLSFEDIYKAIKNIKSSGCRYLLTTSFTNYHKNSDIITGDWRPINLQIEPFSFPDPILIINEHCTESNNRYNDKSMILWEISSL